MLNKKSAVYSDRPVLPVVDELVGMKDIFVKYPNGSRMHDARAMMHRFIGTRASTKQFHPSIEAEMNRLLKWILERSGSDELEKHIRLTVGATILMIAHGYRVKENDDSFVCIAILWSRGFEEIFKPGAFLADTFPVLLRVSDWFPGTSWKQRAREIAADSSSLVNVPHRFVKEQIEKGIALPSFTSVNLEQENISPDRKKLIRFTASTIMDGGADTTVAGIYASFLAMTLYLDIQPKAQAE